MGELRLIVDIPELGEVMANVQELQGKVDALSASVEDMKARVSEDVDNLRSIIEQGQLDQSALDQVTTKLDSISEAVQGVDPDPSNPAAPPAETPEGEQPPAPEDTPPA